MHLLLALSNTTVLLSHGNQPVARISWWLGLPLATHCIIAEQAPRAATGSKVALLERMCEATHAGRAGPTLAIVTRSNYRRSLAAMIRSKKIDGQQGPGLGGMGTGGLERGASPWGRGSKCLLVGSGFPVFALGRDWLRATGLHPPDVIVICTQRTSRALYPQRYH